MVGLSWVGLGLYVVCCLFDFLDSFIWLVGLFTLFIYLVSWFMCGLVCELVCWVGFGLFVWSVCVLVFV